jgi:hypothetical protein
MFSVVNAVLLNPLPYANVDRLMFVAASAPGSQMLSELGARPILGRLPLADDESRMAVISYAFWPSWFGRDSAVIERSSSIFLERQREGIPGRG